MNTSENLKDQAEQAITTLEEAVYHTVLEHNPINRSLTEDFSFELGLTTPEDIAIVKSILYKLKHKGLVQNFAGNEDCWIPKANDPE